MVDLTLQCTPLLKQYIMLQYKQAWARQTQHISSIGDIRFNPILRSDVIKEDQHKR